MTEWIIAGIVVAALIIAGLIKMAGRCSRNEEREDEYSAVYDEVRDALRNPEMYKGNTREETQWEN